MRVAPLAALAVTSVLLAGCGSEGDAEPVASGDFTTCDEVDLSEPPADPVPLRLGGATGVENYAGWFMMTVSPEEYRPNAGSWYELENVPFTDPSQRISAFQSGQLDGFMSSMPQMLAVGAQGIEVKAIAALGITQHDTPTDPRYIVAGNSDHQDFGDLEGTTIGVIGLGSASELLIRIGLEASGVSPDSVTFVNIPAAQHISSVSAGTVDVAIGTQPFLGPALASGAVRDIGGQGFGLVELEDVDYIEPIALVMGQDFLTEHPDVACAYLADYRASLDWLRNDLQEARQVFSEEELVALPFEVYKEAPPTVWPEGDALPSVEYYEAMAKYAEEYGLIPDGSPEAVQDLIWDGLGDVK